VPRKPPHHDKVAHEEGDVTLTTRDLDPRDLTAHDLDHVTLTTRDLDHT